ncbi:plasmolipin [Callorhinchus milii]|uniref:Plasmolipin n=1 Tax=Callorhinchus milii TaxID=7868 RepID=K4FRM7_CALMI|nr:plasmolipin [Callorhinchus milii]AFK10578.1 plasmolipin-like protein [Callorhinchus milii]|eukprot:gi/632978178/ref/XP_007905763.1/ PREDICTED: plasmolipin [Callorhinchus milii]
MEFPDKVSTQTSTASSHTTTTTQTSGRFAPIGVNISFIRSVFGILMMVEMVIGLLVWALIAGSHFGNDPAFGWVMFVAVFLWLLTIILFVLYMLGLTAKLPMVPWVLVVMCFNLGATVLYITAFSTIAARVNQQKKTAKYQYNNRAAAAFFAAVVTIAYGASSFFSFQSWREYSSSTS